MSKPKKFYTLNHKKHGIGGVSSIKPTQRKQDRRAKTSVRYAMVFFPKIDGIGPATLDWDVLLTMRPESAPVVFMDRIAPSEQLKTYKAAGWRLRKIKLTDMGDVDPSSPPSL